MEILNHIGNTPLILVEIESYSIFLKMESFNPGGSIKDRIALAMIENAEKNNLINKNSIIIEPTSGNTGIGLAMICAVKGYKLILVMPESMSIERQKIVQLYGAELVLTPAQKGMRGAIEKAESLARELNNSYIPYQFENPANPEIHYKTTGPEIWQAMHGQIDAFVAGVGTGGSISGIGKYIKEQKSNIHIVAVEPYDSPVLSGGNTSLHKIQGIGAGFIPKTLNTTIYNEIMTVQNEEAYQMSLLLAKKGILCGISSGANVFASLKLAKRNQYQNIVTIICDTGERYLNNFIEYTS
ncbi:MAG TPA: cysteine synthase A [Bacteroidales bacterium]|nr:cysteine synthase A [Bacteroidales bacterium]